MSPPDFAELLRRLSVADVDFVLIGGMAVGAWGVVRGTKDVDIVVDPDPENLARLAEMAVAAHGHVEAGESFLSSQFSIAGQLASGEQVAIETELGRLDVVQGFDGIPSFQELNKRAEQADVLGVTVAVCSVEDLKAMKRASGRTRDLADVEDLEAAND